MRILLIHGEDQALSGAWAGQRWDVVFDLGRGGWAAYERWAQVFRCPVQPIDELNTGNLRINRVRELLEWGRGRLVDREGIDWWDLMSLLVHEQMERVVLLKKLSEDVAASAEVIITRECFEAQALRLMLGDRVRVIDPKTAPRKGPAHYAQRLKRLSGAQILDVLGDKYDGAYRLRRHMHGRPTRQKNPVVLLPSAYVNVSLLGAEYARLLPQTAFLLVATRRSGRLRNAPANIEQQWLASYAEASSAEERAGILAGWDRIRSKMVEVRELSILRELGVLGDYSRRLSEGLAICDAWRQVFERESVQAVLCGDDSNPYTRIPVLLARRRGLPTLACHHGAFDGRYLFKINYADAILAKGKMEQDYLVNVCGVDLAEVEIGAPGVPSRSQGTSQARRNDSIVFFSESYELARGRTEEIYRDLLPRLVSLAASSGKKLVVKLHPSESRHERKTLAAKLLSREEAAGIEWRTGKFSPELLQNAWCAITVLSSAALDCVVHGVPCFLCDWLDLWPYGYVSQYRKFGVGIGLREPEELEKIPAILARWRPDPKVAGDCWKVISPQRLEELLAKGRQAPVAQACEAAR